MRLHIPLPLRWSDLDAYGHVNNATMLRLLEEARVRAFWKPAEGESVEAGELPPTAIIQGQAGSGTLTFLARQEIEYLVQVPYQRAPLDVQVWIGRFGGASVDVCYEVHSPRGSEVDTVYARAEVTLVLVDAADERPRRISDEERETWAPYLEDPVVMRRR